MNTKVSYWPQSRPGTRHSGVLRLFFSVLVAIATIFHLGLSLDKRSKSTAQVPINAIRTIQKCQSLTILPGPPNDFHQREHSDRYVAGTYPTLIRNASIWTGRDSGHEVILGDIFLDKGLIKEIGNIKENVLKEYENLVVLEVEGAWITPGIVDIHSHLGVMSSPLLRGSNDLNSYKGPILPWFRSLDGLNTHDDAYRLSISGGVTTANILPGSANAIGGQAFTIKLRSTEGRSSTAMVLEPPFELNGSHVDPSLRPRWRHVKQACGENISGPYSGTRMDTMWTFRETSDFLEPRMTKEQDDYCVKALNSEWKDRGEFPDNLQWEALVDVLRGHVKVHNHCYAAVNIDGIVRLSNEFTFSIATFHHAHEASIIRAVDGLQFSTRDALLAYRSGVTTGVTAPTSYGFLNGLGTAFTTGSPHRLSNGAVIQEETAVHITIGSSATSVSTQIAFLRSLLNSRSKRKLGESFDKVVKREISLVIHVESADIMMTFSGAKEAHLLAKEIGEAGVGVILRPSHPFPGDWKSRRTIPDLLSPNITLFRFFANTT